MKKGIKIALIGGTLVAVGVLVYMIAKKKGPFNPENKANFVGSNPNDKFFVGACGSDH